MLNSHGIYWDFECMTSDSGPTRTLIVKNLPYTMDSDQLKEAFEKCTDAHVPVFPDSGKPKGYADLLCFHHHAIGYCCSVKFVWCVD
jgi:RNA recognition motif-containing protein